jgi:hypothetical protein
MASVKKLNKKENKHDSPDEVEYYDEEKDDQVEYLPNSTS